MSDYIEINGIKYDNPLFEIKKELNSGRKIVASKSQIKYCIAFLDNEYNPKDYTILPENFDDKSKFGVIFKNKYINDNKNNAKDYENPEKLFNDILNDLDGLGKHIDGNGFLHNAELLLKKIDELELFNDKGEN